MIIPTTTSVVAIEPTPTSLATFSTAIFSPLALTTPTPSPSIATTPQTDSLPSFNLPRAALLCVTVVPGVTIPCLLVIFLYCRHRHRTASALSENISGESRRSNRPLLRCGASRNTPRTPGELDTGLVLNDIRSPTLPEPRRKNWVMPFGSSERRSSEGALEGRINQPEKSLPRAVG